MYYIVQWECNFHKIELCLLRYRMWLIVITSPQYCKLDVFIIMIIIYCYVHWFSTYILMYIQESFTWAVDACLISCDVFIQRCRHTANSASIVKQTSNDVWWWRVIHSRCIQYHSRLLYSWVICWMSSTSDVYVILNSNGAVMLIMHSIGETNRQWFEENTQYCTSSMSFHFTPSDASEQVLYVRAGSPQASLLDSLMVDEGNNLHRIPIYW